MMKNIHSVTCYFIVTVSIFLLMASCGTSDEIRTIEDAPRTAAERAAEADTADQFMEITIGLIEPAGNLDPLFATNLNAMRVMSLIYDGLFTLDKDGEIEYAIASELSVSDDSLTYTVTLDTGLFFHDNAAFMSGIGRRVQAEDVKWAFERTARADVPATASKLLMNISGYEEFFEDQRNIYDPDLRTLDGVSGIVVEDSETISFQLIETDPDFIQKLASPYLYIYPREGVQAERHSLKSNPVGTGAYQIQNITDNSIVLGKVNSDRENGRQSESLLHRIEFVIDTSERQLFQDFARGELDWIPEIGPETKRVALTEDRELTPAYSENYAITSAGHRYIHVYLNDSQRINMSWLKKQLSVFDPDTVDIQNDITVHNTPEQADAEDAGEPDSYYLVTYTDDLFARNLLTQIQQNYLEPDSEFRLSDIRVPVSRTAIFTRNYDSFHQPLIPDEQETWITYRPAIKGIHHQSVEGIENHSVPWKLFVEQIRVELTEERQ